LLLGLAGRVSVDVVAYASQHDEPSPLAEHAQRFAL
jgi:hypothetical protein